MAGSELTDLTPAVVGDLDDDTLLYIVADPAGSPADKSLALSVLQERLSATFAPLDAGRSGTGSPEGVVTAPVGTVYRDTAATNGAVLWVKQAGTGNTGWRVVQGDTGWRNVTGELLNGWTASIVRIRRTVEAVWWHVEGLDGTSSTDLTFLPNFPGFDSATSGVPRFLLHTTTSAVRRGYRGVTALMMASDGATGSLYGTFSAVPALSPPWPTTLPGSAA